MVTTITDEQAEFLERCEAFCKARDAGFFTIMDTNPGDSHNNVKKLAKDMTSRDTSAPLTSEVLKGSVKVSSKLKVDDE
ncbi:hypothetical protein D3C80_1611720 [compost metagenome]